MTTNAYWRANLAIGSFLLLLFAAGYRASLQWPFRAGVFPRMVTATGVFLCLVYVFLHLTRDRPGRVGQLELPEPGDPEVNESPESAFVDAESSDWLRSLFWVALFFIALRVTGLYIAIAAFTVAYLSVETSTRRTLVTLYAALLGGILFAIFDILLSMKMPEGLFL